MRVLITIAQTLLNALQWMVEGYNWLILLPFLAVSLFTMYQMVKRKERLLIFIWYAASVAIGALMIQILFSGIAALIFCGVFAVFYLFFYFRYTERKIKRGRKNRNTRSSRHRRSRRRGMGEDNI